MHKGESSKHVGIWIRVLTEDQVKGESPEHHERRARHYAEAKGWDVVEVYRLDAILGKTVKEPPPKRSACSVTSRRGTSPALRNTHPSNTRDRRVGRRSSTTVNDGIRNPVTWHRPCSHSSLKTGRLNGGDVHY